MSIESIRQSFRPSKIRFLFVGESPPANGTFFYLKGAMTGNMARVFEEVFGRKFESTEAFLAFFKDQGCYLDDVSHTPVNALRGPERRKVVVSGVPALAERMADYKPDYVIAVLKSVEAEVQCAAGIAKLDVPVYAVPFPGMGQQKKFREELTEILKTIYQT